MSPGSDPSPDPSPALCRVVAAAARGDAPGVARAAADAIAAGVPEPLLRGALRMVPPFAGFPRALDAFAAAAPSLRGGGEPAGDPEDAAAAGRAVFDRVYGPDADRILERIGRMDVEVARRVIADAYGRFLSRDDLSLALRERLAVALLAAQGLRNQLPGHVRGALRQGVAPGDLEGDLEAYAPWIDGGAAGDLAGILRAAARKPL